MRADRFPPLPAEVSATWSQFPRFGRRSFADLVGLVLEEVRVDYCRMRLPYRSELEQPAGVVHGGALATLVDTVVVPAIGSAYPIGWRYLTLNLDVQFLAPVREEDAIAEGWVVQRGRSIVFCQAEITAASGRPVVTASLTYKVAPPAPDVPETGKVAPPP